PHHHPPSVLFIPTHILHLFTLFFFTDTSTTEIYTLSLHDALPISVTPRATLRSGVGAFPESQKPTKNAPHDIDSDEGGPEGLERSEEHTSELQSLAYLVCRLLLEKKKKKTNISYKEI